MHFSTAWFRSYRRSIANALLTSLLSVPTASCVKEQSRKQFTSSSNNGSASKDKVTDAGNNDEDEDIKDKGTQKPAPAAKQAPVFVTWDGTTPRGTAKYAVVATE